MTNHANNYSPYGIGFTKKYIYERGGNPVFYVRPEIFSKQEWDALILIFIATASGLSATRCAES